MDPLPPKPHTDERPPLLGSWPRLYAFVLLGNLLWILISWLFMYIYG